MESRFTHSLFNFFERQAQVVDCRGRGCGAIETMRDWNINTKLVRHHQSMKALPPPDTITDFHGNILHYCKQCIGYCPPSEFRPSALKRKGPCRKHTKKRRALTKIEKLLVSVRVAVAAQDKALARRWELSDVVNILQRGKSELSGNVEEKMSVVRRNRAVPFTPDNSLLVTRHEAMSKQHLRSAS